jgi:uncharacterized protein (TIGR02145 family)
MPTWDGCLPEVTTTPVSVVTTNSAVSGGMVLSVGASVVTARGVVYGTSHTPTLLHSSTLNGSGSGVFVSQLTGLSASTDYFLRAYATNSIGTAYGNQFVFRTNPAALGTYPVGTVHCSGTATTVVDVYNPVTGKTWMDRNLGADRAAISSFDAQSFGDLYQWGRAADGHQCRNSPLTPILSGTDIPQHDSLIQSFVVPHDWRIPQNNNLWQGTSGVNNPCPTGYRLPTDAEFHAEQLSWTSNGVSGAFGSPLKLTAGGYRFHMDGALLNVGSSGWYWTSTSSGQTSRLLNISGNTFLSSTVRATGFSVRCIRD